MTVGIGRILREVMNDDAFVLAMERTARAFPEYRARLPVIPYAYSRTQLAKCDRYEVVAMRWSPGSVSPIHDHGSSRCWVLMLEGELDVENFVRDDDGTANPVLFHETGNTRLRIDDVDHRYGLMELHRVRNNRDDAAFSLQLYAEPLSTFSIVDARTRIARPTTATCDLVLDL